MSDKPTLLRSYIDEHGYPIDVHEVGEVHCPKCHKWVDLISETESWVENIDGKMVPDELYIGSFATASHCGMLFADDYGYVKAYILPKRKSVPVPVRFQGWGKPINDIYQTKLTESQ